MEVTGIELVSYGCELPEDLLLRESQRPTDDGGEAEVIRRDEGADDDARTFGQQRHLMAAKTDNLFS